MVWCIVSSKQSISASGFGYEHRTLKDAVVGMKTWLRVFLCRFFPSQLVAHIPSALPSILILSIFAAGCYFIYLLHVGPRLAAKDPSASVGDIRPYEKMVCQKQQLATRDEIDIYDDSLFWGLFSTFHSHRYQHLRRVTLEYQDRV